MNLLFGLSLLLFGFLGLAHRRRLYQDIQNAGKVPITGIERKILGGSEKHAQGYGYAKYVLAQVSIILIGFIALATAFS